MDDAQADRIAIRELIDNWAMWRDAGELDRLATLYHDDGWMVTTWHCAPAQEFIAASRQAWRSVLKVVHLMGASTISVRGDRAVAVSRMTIVQRGPLDGHEVEVTCHGRFWDALERRGGRWGIVLRHPIYDMDRMAAVEPAVPLALDPALLERFPYGYRHLAYFQTRLGRKIALDLPGASGPALEALLARGEPWLAGAEQGCLGVPR